MMDANEIRDLITKEEGEAEKWMLQDTENEYRQGKHQALKQLREKIEANL